MDSEPDHQKRELAHLRVENARLTSLLEAHGIAWREAKLPGMQAAPSPLSTDEKVALFSRLFRGRTDVYPVRWESKAGKSGYSPACANEWRAGICEKPRIKCADCRHRLLIPLSDQILYGHLAGRHTVGGRTAKSNCTGRLVTSPTIRRCVKPIWGGSQAALALNTQKLGLRCPLGLCHTSHAETPPSQASQW